MKNIKNYDASKYKKEGVFTKIQYKEVDKGIYDRQEGKSHIYVTSLSFVQEPKYGEGESSLDISQYPLEDLLDKYYCYISDFYDEKNKKKNKECVLEFASDSLEDVKKLREIIGKHVYNVEIIKDDKKMVKLIIE